MQLRRYRATGDSLPWGSRASPAASFPAEGRFAQAQNTEKKQGYLNSLCVKWSVVPSDERICSLETKLTDRFKPLSGSFWTCTRTKPRDLTPLRIVLANCLHELVMKRLQSLRDHSRMELLEFFGNFCRTAAQKDEKTSSCQLYTKGATVGNFCRTAASRATEDRTSHPTTTRIHGQTRC